MQAKISDVGNAIDMGKNHVEPGCCSKSKGVNGGNFFIIGLGVLNSSINKSLLYKLRRLVSQILEVKSESHPFSRVELIQVSELLEFLCERYSLRC
jgi:hypothetical protein